MNMPIRKVFLKRHIDALTAVLNDYELNSMSWDPDEEDSFDEAVGILNGYVHVNLDGEVIE